MERLSDVLDEEVLRQAARGRGRLFLELEVSDPEVVAELERHPDDEERRRYATAALRLGVLALKTAAGQLDAVAIRDAGRELVGEVRELLSTRATEMSERLAALLATYLDPTTGLLPQRLQSLLAKDGELERVLEGHLGDGESVLARTLAAHVGAGSPIFRMLSPTDADGLRAQLQRAIETVLQEQKAEVLRQFSLDHRDSALSRLVTEIETRQKSLEQGVKGQVDALARELSLDQPTSALSRLVSNLTLDDERSALARLRRELLARVEELSRRNSDFHGEVKATLSALQAQREEAARSTRHGVTFEEHLGALLATEAQRQADVYEATGQTTGAIRHCKTGDHVIELGPESQAPGARIVWEAKEDRSYDLRKGRAEIEEGRKNRQAQLGVFVFSRKTAPESLQPFARYGDDLVVVWDAEDPGSDVFVKAAYSCARALAVRSRIQSGQAAQAVSELDRAVRAVEKQVQYLEQIRTFAQTIHANGLKIVERSERMRDDLNKEVVRLDEHLAALRTGG